jgi:voltage-gated potassium channel
MLSLPVLRPLSTLEREALLLRVERFTELPLLMLAFLMVPMIAGTFLWELTPAETTLFNAFNTAIWVLFAVDFVVKLAIAPETLAYLRGHWLDALIVVIPFFRPLRIVRLAVFGSRAVAGARKLTHSDYIITYAFGAVLLAATLVTTFERERNPDLADFPEALWWAVVTVTTVGYGDITPQTLAGRVTGGFLMVIGIGLFSAITANVASRFVSRDTPAGQPDSESGILLAEVRALRAEVQLLRRTADAEDNSSSNPRQ